MLVLLYGGLIVEEYRRLTDCSFSGKIICENMTSLSIGGIVEYFQGPAITNCENNGEIYVKVPDEDYSIEIGGIVWEHDNGGDIISCVNSGDIAVIGSGKNVDTSTSGYIGVGGIEATKYCSGPIEKCTNTGNITVEGCAFNTLNVGGIAGESEGKIFNNLNMGELNVERCVGTTDTKISVRRNYWF